jgi:hypothetical protein
MRSPAPWITSTGQRSSAHASSIGATTAPSRPSRPATVSTTVAGSFSSAHPIASSIGLVECRSLNIFRKKKSRKSA